MPTGKLKTAAESELAANIRSAVGAGPNEIVNVMTPQFKRPKGSAGPGSPPRGLAGWERLSSMSQTFLCELGLRAWGRHDKYPDGTEGGPMLMLFPGEWYASIPNGLKIVNIFFKEEEFRPGTTEDDIRCGCLPFGVYAKD